MKPDHTHPEVEAVRMRFVELNDEHNKECYDDSISNEEMSKRCRAREAEKIRLIDELLKNPEFAPHVTNMAAYFFLTERVYEISDMLEKEFLGSEDSESGQGYYYHPACESEKIRAFLTNIDPKMGLSIKPSIPAVRRIL